MATKVRQALSREIGKLSEQIRYRNRYAYVLGANESIHVPHDFILTAIAKAPVTNVCLLQNAAGASVVLANDNSNIEFNIEVDENERLFLHNAPWLGIPNLPQKYEMPCFWYMPRGTIIKFATNNFQIATFTSGDTEFPPTIILEGFFIDEPDPGITSRLFRPLIIVFKHKPAVVHANVNPSGTVGTDGITKQEAIAIPTNNHLWMRKLSYCAIRDISLGVPPAVTQYAAQLYCDWVGRIAYNTNFYFSDSVERIDATITNHEWPLDLKKLARINGGNSIVMETSYTTGAPGSLIGSLYTFVGGILRKDTTSASREIAE